MARDWLLWWVFLAAAGFRAAAPVRGQAGAPAAGAPVRARARTNELDAGKRRPMIASEESLLGCGLPWMRRPLGCWLPGGRCVSPAEWVSHPPIRPPARGG